jgi:DNA-binding transcriptional LysR family regulator
MNIEHIQCFVTLAEELHFGRAADQLGVSTPTLSKRLVELETEVGVRLFERTSRRVTITAAGRELLETARASLRSYRDFAEAAADVAGGRVGRLVTFYSNGNGSLVGALVRRLRAERPAVQVALEQRTSIEVIEAVRAGEAGAGICRNLLAPGLDHVVLACASRDRIALPQDHPLADRSSLLPSDLAGQTFIEAALSYGSEGEDDLRAFFGDAIHIRRERATSEAELLDRVAAGEGLGLFTAATVTRNPRPDLAVRPYGGPPIGVPVTDRLIWRLDNDDPLVRALVAVARTMPAAATP